MKIKKSVPVAVVAGLVAAGLVACGGDESSDSTTTAAALSSDELISQTNEVCKTHADAINSAVAEITKGGQPSAVDVRVTVKETIWPQYAAQIGQLQELTPPDDQADAWNQWLADSTTQLDAIKEDPNAALDASQFATVNSGAEDLGLSEDCLAGPTA